MPATAAQVFGPTTVDPGFNSTGEKTLLTMNTTLPAGGKNVIIAVVMPTADISIDAWGKFRIKKGDTILYETGTAEYFNREYTRCKPTMLLAVDTNPTGNDSYTFTINITAAGTDTSVVHVEGMVVKTDDAEWAYNTTVVSINAGATATVTSLTTNYPANSKVVALAYIYAAHAAIPSSKLLGAGNVKLKLNDTVISSNQFNTGSYADKHLANVNLAWLGTVTSSSQSWEAEITNGSTVTFYAWAIIVTFTVSDGAFLDTGSVALTNGTQVTVGNLSTTLSGNIAVIGLAAAENTTTNNVTAFNANDVVLQKDNSSTDQIANLIGWYLYSSSTSGRSGILPLLRVDSATNPSYQIKMTARASGINGEAKIVAFSTIVTHIITDSGTGLDSILITAKPSVSDSCIGVEKIDMSKELKEFGSGVEMAIISISPYDYGAGADEISIRVETTDNTYGVEETLIEIPSTDYGETVEIVDMEKEVDDSGIGEDSFTGGIFKIIDESGLSTELVNMVKESNEFSVGIEYVNTSKEVLDSVLGIDMVNMSRIIDDAGIGDDYIGMSKEVHDDGTSIDIVSMTKELADSGTVSEYINMSKGVLDSGVGVEEVVSPRLHTLTDYVSGVESVINTIPQTDSGGGIDSVNMLKETKDSGAGVDIIDMLKGIADFGAGAEAVYISATVVSYDYAYGFDTINIVGYVYITDVGSSVEYADWFISIYGTVLIDNENIGIHSIPYNDLKHYDIPIQTQRRSVDDKIYIDDCEIGHVVVEWEDKVSDITPGERTVIITGLVNLYD